MRRVHSKIRVHKYKGGCVLGETLLAKLLGVDLTYHFNVPCLMHLLGQGNG